MVDFALKDEAQVAFYNRNSCPFEPDPDCSDTRAVNMACAPWKVLGREGTVIEARKLTGMVTDYRDRVLLHPITDGRSRLIGMSGMLLSTKYFKQTYLPEAIRQVLARSLPGHERDELIVSVRDSSGKLVASSQQAEGKETGVSLPMPYIFRDWTMEVRSRHLTAEQWAQLHFVINLLPFDLNDPAADRGHEHGLENCLASNETLSDEGRFRIQRLA